MGQTIMVGMAEIKIAVGSEDILAALGLGSCIGVCAYDPLMRVAGMAHVVLPESLGAGADPAGKYADTAIPALLEEMQRAGAAPGRICIAIAGGAQLFTFAGATPRLDIGQRNMVAVMKSLEKYSLNVVAQDTGGNAGRTVHLFVGDGRVRVKTIGQGEKDLVVLSAPVLLARAA